MSPETSPLHVLKARLATAVTVSMELTRGPLSGRARARWAGQDLGAALRSAVRAWDSNWW